MLYIISTFDECGVEEYKTLLRSIRKHAKGLDVRLVGLYGEISPKSKRELSGLIDDLECFDDYASYTYFWSTYGERLFHPMGKFAKLFFVREYVEAHCKPTDRVLFLDPDTVVQRPLKEFLKHIVPGTVLFGYEIQLIHHLQRDNQRLKVAESFDEIGGWKNTYMVEINTGVNLSIAEDFLTLMKDFEEFVVSSEYLKSLDTIRDGVKWHDQDFFRYFYRKTLRLDVGCVDLGVIFTTTLGASKCLYYDAHAEVYKTNWDAVPIVVHFAGGTMGRVPRIEPLTRMQTDPVALPARTVPVPEPAPSPRAESVTEIPAMALPLEVVEQEFMYARHAVLASTGAYQLVERWLHKLPAGAQVLLVIPADNREEGVALQEKYARLIRSVAHVGMMDGTVHESLKDALNMMPGLNSVMIPFLGEQVELQFLPGNTMPNITPYYKMIRGLWHQGFRRFFLHSFSGTKHVQIPLLLDHYVDQHKGKRCFIVGNGPSLNDLDMSFLRDEITFGANRCYLGYEDWGYDFTYWGVMDRLQIEEYGAEYMEHVPAHTPKFFPFEYATLMDMENACPVPFEYDGRPPYKFSGSPDTLHLGFTVVHMMLQIAVIMGCDPIYLVGCDHRYNLNVNKKESLGTKGAQVWTAKDASTPTHFTNEYTEGSGEAKKFITPKPERMDEAFDAARKWCDEHSVQVLNATPNSGLKAFPMVEYASLFPGHQKSVPEPIAKPVTPPLKD